MWNLGSVLQHSSKCALKDTILAEGSWIIAHGQYRTHVRCFLPVWPIWNFPHHYRYRTSRGMFWFTFLFLSRMSLSLTWLDVDIMSNYYYYCCSFNVALVKLAFVISLKIFLFIYLFGCCRLLSVAPALAWETSACKFRSFVRPSIHQNLHLIVLYRSLWNFACVFSMVWKCACGLDIIVTSFVFTLSILWT